MKNSDSWNIGIAFVEQAAVPCRRNQVHLPIGSFLRRDPGERLRFRREKPVFNFLFRVIAWSSPWPHPGDLFNARLVVLGHDYVIAPFHNIRSWAMLELKSVNEQPLRFMLYGSVREGLYRFLEVVICHYNGAREPLQPDEVFRLVVNHRIYWIFDHESLLRWV